MPPASLQRSERAGCIEGENPQNPGPSTAPPPVEAGAFGGWLQARFGLGVCDPVYTCPSHTSHMTCVCSPLLPWRRNATTFIPLDSRGKQAARRSAAS